VYASCKTIVAGVSSFLYVRFFSASSSLSRHQLACVFGQTFVIQWLPAAEGGRSLPIGFGFRYYPLVEFIPFVWGTLLCSLLLYHFQINSRIK